MANENFTHKCLFKFVDTGNKKYKVRWVLSEIEGKEIERKEEIYAPRETVRIPDMNAARTRINQWIRMKYAMKGMVRGIKFFCLNDASDFKSHAEKMKAAYAAKRKQKREETRLAQAQPKPEVEVRNPVDGKNLGRRFEVVNIGGVWTITMHEKELLTEQEAKDLLFQKIAQGE